MDIVSLIIAVLLAAMMLFLLVRLPLAIFGNLRTGQKFRDGLADTLDKLRLSRMLRHLGIEPNAYLHNQPGVTIRNHIARCDGCGEKARCDQVLDAADTPDTDSLGFCANIDDLKVIPRQ